MESPAHFRGEPDAASCGERPRAGDRRQRRATPGHGERPSGRRRYIAWLLAGVGVLLIALAASVADSTLAAPGCAGGQRTSADGTIAYGSPCSDRIVVTSPSVKAVYAGAGNDVIYANPDVKEIYGGEGDDVIYGELPESTATSAVLETPTYAPARRLDRAARMGKARAKHLTRGFGFGATLLSTTTSTVECESSPCYGGDGSQEMFGGPGRDEIFGGRGNDILHGGAGPDLLFGGIGDDTAFGDDGNDILSGGLGTDLLDGNEGSDTVRGEGTVDKLRDTGKEGSDTLSFATAVTPGFHGAVSIPGFPADAENEERGVEVRLDGGPTSCGLPACNNDARYGGGGDEISVSGFENVIGSPFADRIIGSNADNRLDGGGGVDILEGEGGNDQLYGGADGDYIVGGEGEDTTYQWGEPVGDNCAPDVEHRYTCSGSSEEVHPRDRSKIEVGYMSPPTAGTESWSLYMVGSESADLVKAKVVFGGLGGYALFTAEPGSAAFDTSPTVATPNCKYQPAEVKCVMPAKIDAITLAGMAGDDNISLITEGMQWHAGLTPVLLGGEGNDTLTGGTETEDLLVDGNGPGNDVLSGLGHDDGLINNEGYDQLIGGNGSDLLLSSTTCEGDVLQGASSTDGDGEAVNSASWAQLPAAAGGVVADLRKGQAGSFSSGGPACPEGLPVDRLANINDLEGSAQADALYGDSGSNNILGRKGEDGLYGREGDDSIEAEDHERDRISGGGGTDLCTYDKGMDIVNLCGDVPGMGIGESERAAEKKPPAGEEHAKH